MAAVKPLPSGRYVILPDLQAPYHDQRAVDNVCTWITRQNFDGMLNVGDESDSPEPSRRVKGLAGEYSGTLLAGLLTTQRVVGQLGEALGAGKPHHIMRSNHADRVETYIKRYTPALTGLPPLKWESLIGYGQQSSLNGRTLDVTFHRRIWQFAPGWCLAHGDEGSLSQVPGSTAMSLAKKTGRSIVCGHTHRAGVQHHTQGFNGKVTNTLHGVEVGHLMDMTKASYLKSGGGNWRQAVAVATIDGSAVDVTLRLLHNGKVLG